MKSSLNSYKKAWRCLFVVLSLGSTVLTDPSFGQSVPPVLNVTNFGARGDAVQFWGNTTSNSADVSVESSNFFSDSDVGKLVELFGVGPATAKTNYQDLIATIKSVTDGAHITLSLKASATVSNVLGLYGTQNAAAFQACVDACTGTNTIIDIPSGNFLLVAPGQLTNYASSYSGWPVGTAVTLKKGGIHFRGAGMTNTVLTGCGAWKLQGTVAHRGWIFNCQGPVSNNYPLVFSDLTMDGGVTNGNTLNHTFPASAVDGTGWDMTHDAVVDSGSAPLHVSKTFQNCRFANWRGEEVKSCAAYWDGFILMTNCIFCDGNASGFNFSFSHRITHCTFINLPLVMEFYQGYYSNACSFDNNVMTNITGHALAINGALTNHPPPPYNITSNILYLSTSGGYGILTSPAQNLSIVGNQFICTNYANGIGTGCAGYQGTAFNSNILIANNHFFHAQAAISVLGSDQNRTVNMLVSNNTAIGCSVFASGYGWSTNVVLVGNKSDSIINGNSLKGQLFLDDPSNVFGMATTPDWKGITNILTYAYGGRQITYVGVTNAIYVIDDSRPQTIPPGAQIYIINTNFYPSRLYLSNTGKNTVLKKMNVGTAALCVWTNGAWQFSLISPGNLYLNNSN